MYTVKFTLGSLGYDDVRTEYLQTAQTIVIALGNNGIKATIHFPDGREIK